MRVASMAVVLLGWVLAVGPRPAGAQDEPPAEPENVAILYVVDVTLGSEANFESALTQYMAWRAEQEDPWTWTVFQVVNGRLGRYLIRSGNHLWADFDAYAEADPDPEGQRFLAAVGPFVDAIESNLTQANSLVSHMPDDLSGYSLYAVTEYELSNALRFNAAIQKFHQAAQQIEWTGHYAWATVVNGGAPRSVVVVPAEGWAGLAPPEKSVIEVMVEAYGEQEMASTVDQFGDAYRSATSYLVRPRPDLSLIPQPE